ncbi:hypothetical protein VIGAN_06263700 [Vigna angularis var. angularis]|uniref:Response regulatory domain-containing protein n=1 Tax=Vigna angularis var. angularis TaxID=157739 RepID=A0A0S3SER2_PHAAN|nr:hypothetical protein VIGAN_06263700 [Vigna angularis var. angularis]
MGKISSEKKVFSEYPSNLKVLAIDTDPIVLEFIKKVCNEYCYEVMSFDDSKKSVMKTIKLGACDYMIKPLHEDRLRNMWTHVVRKSMNEDKMRKNIRNSLEDDNQNSRFVFSSSDEISREVGNAGQSKKPRVVWTTDLHGKFVKAVNQLGLEILACSESQSAVNALRKRKQRIDLILVEVDMPIMNGYEFLEFIKKEQVDVPLIKATPKKVLEVMNDPRLERTHIASHLQKYRKYLKQQQQKQEQQQQQNDMSLVSGRQIERQQSKQKDMSLPRTSALQPCSATATTNFHPGFTGNMEEEALAHGHPLAAFPNVVIPENFSEEQSNINRLLSNNFNAEQVLAHDHPSAIFPNIASNLISQPGTLDDASIYGLLTPSDTPLFVNPTILQIDTMQQPMNHNQMYPMNFQPSFTMISGNPAFASQNYNFGMNMGHGSQSIQDGNSIGEGILDQYSTIDSIYHPEFQNAGLPSGAVRRFAASDYRSQNPYIDGNLYQQ